ncbi:MAG: GAF domain-containing protein [bacterium]
MRPVPLRLGPKLNLSLLLFILILGTATAVLVLVGFNRTQDNAAEKSRQGLENEGRRTLATLSGQQAYIGELQLSPAAEWGHQAGWFLGLKGQTAPAFDGSSLQTAPNGTIYDPTPGRGTDIILPAGTALTGRPLKDAYESQILDGYFNSLFTNYQGRLIEEPFRPIAIFYLSVDGVTRYYPPTNALLNAQTTVAEIANLHHELGPDLNPNELTVWTPPYEDEAGRGPVLTAYTPVYDETGYRGVIGVDVSLERLTEQVEALSPTVGGYGFYVDREGEFLKTSRYDKLEALAAPGANPAFRAAVDDMIAGKSNVARFKLDGRDMFVAFAPMQTVGGSLALVAPVDEITAEAAGVTESIQSEGNRTVGFIILVMILLFLMALVSTAWLNRRLLLSPIESLVSGTRAVAAGNFNASIPVQSRDELGDLAGSFNSMIDEIRIRNDALIREIAEREQTARTLAEREESTRQIFQSVSDAIFITDTHDKIVDANVAAEALYGYTLEEMRELEPFGLIHPSSRGRSTEYLETVAAGKQFRGRALSVRKDGSTFMSDVFGTGAMYFGEPHILSVIRDITEQVEQQQLLERRVDERTRELSLMLQISTSAASTLDTTEMFELILDQIEDVVHYDGASILVVEDGALVVKANRAFRKGELRGAKFPIGPLQQEMERGPVRPLLLADIHADTPLAANFRAQVGGYLHTAFIGVTSFLGAPMQRQGRLIGQIALSSQKTGAFSEADAALMMAIANQAAIAIENARLFTESERRAKEMTALSRIATTLDLGQSVTGTLNSVAQRIVESTNAVAASVSTVTPDGMLLLGGGFGLPFGFFDAVDAALKRGAPRANERALHEGAPVVTRRLKEQIANEPAYAELGALLKDTDWETMVIVPMRYGDRNLGTVETFFGPRDVPDEREIGLISAMARQAATAIENAFLFSQTEKRVRQLEALTLIASSFSLELSLSELMDRMSEHIVRATTSLAAAVTLAEGPFGGMRMIGTYGVPEGFADAMEESFRQGAGSTTRQAMAERRTIYQSNLRPDRMEDARYGPVRSRIENAEWDSVLLSPIIHGNQALGVLMLGYPKDAEPDAEERAFVDAVADQTGLVIENARLYQRASSAAALEERQRLARELHDSVSQALYGIALGARTARRRVGDDGPANVTEPLDYVLSLAEAGLTEMRALIFELRPESIATEGLVAAIGRQVAATQARYGVKVTANLADEPDVSLDVKEALYRITQESMHNTVKHARAQNITVNLIHEEDEVRLEIQDDGQGFDPSGEFPGHLGLRSMQERARDIGGRLEIESSPGEGTRITLRVEHVPED